MSEYEGLYLGLTSANFQRKTYSLTSEAGYYLMSKDVILQRVFIEIPFVALSARVGILASVLQKMLFISSLSSKITLTNNTSVIFLLQMKRCQIASLIRSTRT